MAIHQSPLNKFFAFERQQQIGLDQSKRRRLRNSQPAIEDEKVIERRAGQMLNVRTLNVSIS